MKKIIIALFILFASSVTIDYQQGIAKSWKQSEVQELINKTVIIRAFSDFYAWEGSGVLIDSRGIILTAAHVVADSNEDNIFVYTSKGTAYKCDLLLIDTAKDLALIRINNSSQKFKYAKMQKSNDYFVGQDIVIVGHPEYLYWTVSKGSITRKFFHIPDFSWRFDTNAFVNPGSSGGPVFNEFGEVIGIVSAMHVNWITDVPIGIGIIVTISEIHKFLDKYLSKNTLVWPKPKHRLGDLYD